MGKKLGLQALIKAFRQILLETCIITSNSLIKMVDQYFARAENELIAILQSLVVIHDKSSPNCGWNKPEHNWSNVN